MKRKIIISFTSIMMLMSLLFCGCSKDTHQRIKKSEWEKETKNSINEFLSAYGIDSSTYSNDSYCVIDIDGICRFSDLQEEFWTYKAENPPVKIKKDPPKKDPNKIEKETEAEPVVEIEYPESYFSDLSENQIYQIAKKTFSDEKNIFPSTLKEFMAALSDNGIDVYLVSSSLPGIVRAAVDISGVHSSCAGVLGMTYRLNEGGKYINDYDFTSGSGFFCNKDGTWTRMKKAELAKTQDAGKIQAVKNAVFSEYHNAGPIAAVVAYSEEVPLMITQFDSMKLALTFNFDETKKIIISENAQGETAYCCQNIQKKHKKGEALPENIIIYESIKEDENYHSIKCTLEKRSEDYQTYMEDLVSKMNAKVGISIRCGDEYFSLNDNDAFPLLSVYKIQVVYAVLEKLEKKAFSLDKVIHVTQDKMHKDTYSPLLDIYPDQDFDISVAELIDYTITKSDNNATDILIEFAGGIKAVKKSCTKIAKKLGVKNGFEILHTEATMHVDLMNCYQNWATPLFISEYFSYIMHSTDISKIKREYFAKMLFNLETGKDRIISGLPTDIQFAHKTGTGPRLPDGLKIADNDVGMCILPDGRELYITVLICDSYESDEADAKLMQDIARASYSYFNFEYVRCRAAFCKAFC